MRRACEHCGIEFKVRNREQKCCSQSCGERNKRLPLAERFLNRQRSLSDGCIEWIGTIGKQGYGKFVCDGKRYLAHRLAKELQTGAPIAFWLVCDHLCRNRKCVNPVHIEIVTLGENARRGAVHRAVAIRCVHGHEMKNALINHKGYRLCRECNKTRSKNYRNKIGGSKVPQEAVPMV